MTKLYGIPNCDTVKKARKWLDEHGAPYPVLTNFVTESNDAHLRLIKYLGFTLGDPVTIPGTNVRAIPFERRR